MPKPAPLAAAVLSARKQQWDTVLVLLLQVWDRIRPPELAALIEAVSAHLQPSPPPLVPPLEIAWTTLAATRRPSDLPTLLEELVHEVRSGEIAIRIKALGQFPSDPRISSHYVKMLAAPPFTAGSSRATWMSILDQLLTTHLDPRTPQRMRDLEPEYLSIFGATVMGKSMKFQLKAYAKKIDVALAKLEKATNAELEAVAAILALVPAARSAPVAVETPDDHAYFWKRIAESPDDPARRAEYRSWLVSQNDPRAEFIAIQELKAIHGRLPVKEKAREQELFDKHHKEWLGPLAPLIMYPVFENGYLTTCVLKPKGTLTGKLAGHPLWATVREMNVNYNKQQGHAVVLHPMMKSLKKLTTVNESLFQQLLRPDAPPRPIEHIETWCLYRDLIRPDQPAPGLPKLKRLEVEYDGDDDDECAAEYLPFWSSPLVSRLDSLRIINWAVDLSDWKDFLTTEMPDSVHAEIDLENFIFRRSADGKYSSVEVALQIDDYGNLYDRNSMTHYMKTLAAEEWSEILIRKPANTSAATWKAVEKAFAKVEYKVI